MTMKLSIVDGAKTVDLELEQMESQHITAVINGAFRVFGVNPAPRELTGFEMGITEMPPKPMYPMVSPKEDDKLGSGSITGSLISVKPKADEKQPEVITITLGEKQKEEVQRARELQQQIDGRPHTLPLIGGPRTAMVSVGEKITSMGGIPTENEPEHWKTGIKDKGGIPHYKCSYWCKKPGCRNRGRHYVALGEKQIQCHNCGTEHIVRTAGPLKGDGIPEQDRHGNFYIADRLASEQSK